MMDTITRNLVSICNEATNSNDSVNSLRSLSAGIAHFISVINRISEQTNLLVLNAVIEASRARRAGWGFAVVADEAQSREQKSGEGTAQIGQLVKRIDDQTAQTEALICGMNTKTRSASESADEV